MYRFYTLRSVVSNLKPVSCYWLSPIQAGGGEGAHIGHHLKQVLVDSNLGCCHGNTFCQGALGQNFQF